jgi:hypothetical protein
VIRVAELVGERADPVERRHVVDEDSRLVADKRHAKSSSSLTVSWLGVDPMLGKSSPRESGKTR